MFTDRLINYFGFVGMLSVVLWVAALGVLVYGLGCRYRRSRLYGSATAMALVALMAAGLNGTLISHIRYEMPVGTPDTAAHATADDAVDDKPPDQPQDRTAAETREYSYRDRGKVERDKGTKVDNPITGDEPTGGEGDDWSGTVGFVPTVLQEAAPPSDNGVAVLCGPPIMIKFTLPILKELKFGPGDIYTTLENRMKCGIGKCGRCNVGSLYVCKDGPVFTVEQIEKMPQGDM